MRIRSVPDFFFQDEMNFVNGRIGRRSGRALCDVRTRAARRTQYYKPVPGKEPRTIDSQKLLSQFSRHRSLDRSVLASYARFAEGFKMPTAQQLYTSAPGWRRSRQST